jgi:hypothetical protein
MFKKITLPLVLLFLSFGAKAQLGIGQYISDTQEIIFDQQGKMIKFPRVFISKSTAFDFKVITSKSVMQGQFNTFRDLLKTTDKFLDNNEGTYACIFDTATAYLNFRKRLKSAISILEPVKIDDPQSISNAEGQLEKSGINYYIPVTKFIENWKNQYVVETYTNAAFTKTTPLAISLGATADTYYYFQNSELLKIKDLKCQGCIKASNDDFHFKLVYKDPLQSTISEWYTLKADSFSLKLDKITSPDKEFKDDLGAAAEAADASAFKEKMGDFRPAFKQWMIN